MPTDVTEGNPNQSLLPKTDMEFADESQDKLKILISSEMEARILRTLRKLDDEFEKLDLRDRKALIRLNDWVRMLVSRILGHEDVTNAWLQYLSMTEREPVQVRPVEMEDGTTGVAYYDMTFKNPEVRRLFREDLFRELEYRAAQLDDLSQLGFMRGFVGATTPQFSRTRKIGGLHGKAPTVPERTGAMTSAFATQPESHAEADQVQGPLQGAFGARLPAGKRYANGLPLDVEALIRTDEECMRLTGKPLMTKVELLTAIGAKLGISKSSVWRLPEIQARLAYRREYDRARAVPRKTTGPVDEGNPSEAA